MATRTIPNWRDRLATIMIAPLMTCSARLPVYALLIGAFIPRAHGRGPFNLQGLVLFALYVAGIARRDGGGLGHEAHGDARAATQPLMLELPAYHWPNLRNLALGLWERVRIFLTRVGRHHPGADDRCCGSCRAFPAPPPGATGPAIQYSLAGMIGARARVHVRADRLQLADLDRAGARASRRAKSRSARSARCMRCRRPATTSPAQLDAADRAAAGASPTALSLLAWYVFAPQCLSTLAAVKRETNSWRYPLIMAGYLFALAYVASFVTYNVAVWFMGKA